KYALSKIGSAYTYAGVGPSYDCIGLVWRAWQVAGSKWEHGSVQYVAHTKWVRFISADQLRPGDLIMWSFWDGSDVLDHIGMIVDPRSGTFVHAESTSTGVRLSNWKRESFYQHPAAFGRVVS
ncbi:MAG: NlpC/P60 family protein, partial [Actinomycetes bacterium]